MIKIHKLEDGDIIKILPMIDKNDKISWIKQYECIGLNSKTFICDDSNNGYLKRISHKLRQSNSSINLPVSTKYAMNIYIDGDIRILNVGKTLFQIIIDNPKLWDIRGNHQIFVVKKEVSAGGGQVFPDWKKSYVSEKSWTPPVNDINSQDEWVSYIKSNGPDFDSHLQKSNIFNHKQLLIDYLGKDMLSELISDDRQNKLKELGV
jgi:hypothetical protein